MRREGRRGEGRKRGGEDSVLHLPVAVVYVYSTALPEMRCFVVFLQCSDVLRRTAFWVYIFALCIVSLLFSCVVLGIILVLCLACQFCCLNVTVNLRLTSFFLSFRMFVYVMLIFFFSIWSASCGSFIMFKFLCCIILTFLFGICFHFRVIEKEVEVLLWN